MPGISMDNATEHEDHGPVEEWSTTIDGQTISFVSFKVDIDSTPMLRGLPGDRCPCPHWGYVIEGRVTFTFDHGEETYGPGDAFYAPAGHGQRADAGTVYLQFSPADELRRVSETLMNNMRAMQGA
jgi:hypothetical protein